MYLLRLSSLQKIFSYFTINLLKFKLIYKLFPSKTAYCVKRQIFSKKKFEKFAFYGLDMELEPEP
jgi:hypothetical protein